MKVFPAGLFGCSYIKDILGPFDNIKLLACGGVTAENVSSFFSSGASAVAFGGSIFKKEWLKAGEFNKISSAIKSLLMAKSCT